MAQVNEAFLSSISAATNRYEERADERAATAAALSKGGILAADDATHIAKRLARLNAGWSLAEAIDRTAPVATTGRSLVDTVPPELFDTNVLGLERLMGRNDLIDVVFLQRGAMAARSVGRISVRSPRGSGYGTGFLVSPRLLLTNHHVLGDAGEAAASYVEFDYQSGPDGLPLSPKAFTFDPGALFLSSPADQLDFTLVAVAPTGTHGETVLPADVSIAPGRSTRGVSLWRGPSRRASGRFRRAASADRRARTLTTQHTDLGAAGILAAVGAWCRVGPVVLRRTGHTS